MPTSLRWLILLVGALSASAILVVANGHFFGIWLPVGLGFAFWLCSLQIASLDRARPWLSVGAGSGATALWLMTRETRPPEKWIELSILAPKVCWWIAGGALLVFVLQGGLKRSSGWWALVAVGCAWIIAFESAGAGGAEHTRSFLERFFGIPSAISEPLTVGLRKCLHYGFYAFVAASAWTAGRGSPKRVRALFALGLALSYACFDEYRQSYFVNRTASPLDVMLDMTGAGTATAIGWRRVAPPKEES